LAYGLSNGVICETVRGLDFSKWMLLGPKIFLNHFIPPNNAGGGYSWRCQLVLFIFSRDFLPFISPLS